MVHYCSGECFGAYKVKKIYHINSIKSTIYMCTCWLWWAQRNIVIIWGRAVPCLDVFWFDAWHLVWDQQQQEIFFQQKCAIYIYINICHKKTSKRINFYKPCRMNTYQHMVSTEVWQEVKRWDESWCPAHCLVLTIQEAPLTTCSETMNVASVLAFCPQLLA